MAPIWILHLTQILWEEGRTCPERECTLSEFRKFIWIRWIRRGRQVLSQASGIKNWDWWHQLANFMLKEILLCILQKQLKIIISDAECSQSVLRLFSKCSQRKEPLILCTIEGYVYSLIKSEGFCVNASRKPIREKTPIFTFFVCER